MSEETSQENDGVVTRAAAISDLPDDELIHYGRELGLSLDAKMGTGELLRRVRQRQALLLELDRDALLEIVVWARRPVRESATTEELVREIAWIKKVDMKGLSRRGLLALASLRDVPAFENDSDQVLATRIKSAEPLWDRVRRKRRRWMGSLISQMVNSSDLSEGQGYRFLPEEKGARSLKDQIAEEGVVSGLARKIRGAADDYVHEKLDEIELRIDHKLDEIDKRLAEWRDREIANRLKIIRITLVLSVIVALLSLGYSFLRPH